MYIRSIITEAVGEIVTPLYIGVIKRKSRRETAHAIVNILTTYPESYFGVWERWNG
jgi:hypothetical protein